MATRANYRHRSRDLSAIGNFLLHHRSLAKVWTLFDNSGEIPNVIAFQRDEMIRIIERSAHSELGKRDGRT